MQIPEPRDANTRHNIEGNWSIWDCLARLSLAVFLRSAFTLAARSRRKVLGSPEVFVAE